MAACQNYNNQNTYQMVRDLALLPCCFLAQEISPRSSDAPYGLFPPKCGCLTEDKLWQCGSLIVAGVQLNLNLKIFTSYALTIREKKTLENSCRLVNRKRQIQYLPTPMVAITTIFSGVQVNHLSNENHFEKLTSIYCIHWPKP